MNTHLLVIGGASADILHTTAGKITAAGGAGMYTAMAAHRGGMPVSLFAPRPSPLSEALKPVADRLEAWLGPVVRPEELAHFEISHLGGQTIYLQASVGAEAFLQPADLPVDLGQFSCAHVIPLGSVSRQLDFVRACRQRGVPRISVSSHIEHIRSTPQLVRQVLAEADFGFMNEEEAAELFGSIDKARVHPGKVLFVTLGPGGCLVIQGEHMTRLYTSPVSALDPTGAGDTFCGAALSRLAAGAHPIMAAHAAMPLASQMIAHPGPSALFFSGPQPEIVGDSRVTVDSTQVNKTAHLVASLPEVEAFNFVGPFYPPPDHPAALDLFFASTLQQFGFWSLRDGVYHQPLVAPINGAVQKGSTYLFLAYLRAMWQDPNIFSPDRQAKLTEDEMRQFFRADDGSDPMPALDLHLAQARQYGQDMLALDLSPEQILRRARTSNRPLQTFLEILDQIGGYKEDPLRKKASLLALILNQRPEHFLPFAQEETVAPVIDYHLMRSCLRVGLVNVHDAVLLAKLAARQALSPLDEWAVRWAAYRAVEQVVALSGKSMGAVDWFFFNARRRCPEMTEPACMDCPVNPVCVHRKELFQPVFRTTFY